MREKILELLKSKTESCSGVCDVIYYDELEDLAKELESLFSLNVVGYCKTKKGRGFVKPK